MSSPEFVLRNVFKVIAFGDETTKPELGHRSGSDRTDAAKPPKISRARITDWARSSGGCISQEELCAKLNSYQVRSELDAIFRETPSFGRSIARRLQDYHLPDTDGPYQLIGGGGEAVVFFDEETQNVIKLLSTAGKARFGWEVSSDLEGNREVVAGSLATGLIRYARAEEMFPTGLEIEALADDGSFLLMRQPFIFGENPYRADLDKWMKKLGWQKFVPQTESKLLSELTWKKDGLIATDVRPENVIISQHDGEFYSIDFIMSDL